MAKSWPHAGNFNLRGKRSKLLSCECLDLRPKLRKIEAAKEVREALSQ